MRTRATIEKEITGKGICAFAHSNGWKPTKASFSVHALANAKMHDGGRREVPEPRFAASGALPPGFESIDCLDHAEYYRDNRNRAVCIVAHLYTNNLEAARKFAMLNQLEASILDDAEKSWWYPGWTTTIAYHRKDTVIAWPDYVPEKLPEKDDSARTAQKGNG